jgi:hypothetical protein
MIFWYTILMSELKTKETSQKPEDFLNTIESDSKREDGFKLLELFKKVTGEKPVMWGTSIIGFGKYHYKSERSKQEGDWPLVGFSPRKQNLTLYVLLYKQENPYLSKLGKHKTGGGCLYINKLSDVDVEVLSSIIKSCFDHMKKTCNIK